MNVRRLAVLALVLAAPAGAAPHRVTDILDPAAPGWQLVTQGEGAIGGLTVNRDGDAYFSDERAIRRVEHATAKVSVFKAVPTAVALAFGPDRRLYASLKGAGIAAFDEGAHGATILREAAPTDIAIDARGQVWFAEPQLHQVSVVDAAGHRRVVLAAAPTSSTIALSPEPSVLVVAAASGGAVWSHVISADGGLRDGKAFYLLRPPDAGAAAGAAGMTVDSEGFLYVASPQGIQVFDPHGRLNAILAGPPGAAVSRIAFAGPQLDTLYAVTGDRLYRRKLRRKGVLPWQPVKPPAPRR
jgi:gluconolactonase